MGKVGPLSPAHDLLKVGDVLLEIDGIPVASDGTVQFPANWTRGSLELNGSSVKSSSSSQSKRKGGVKEEIITDEEEEGDVAGGNGSASMAVDEEWEDEEEEEIGNVPRRYDNDMDMDAFERIDLGFLISQKFVGDKANLKILRNPALVKEEEEQREKSKQDYISKEKENQVFLPLDIPKSIGLPAAKPSEMEVEIPLRGRDTLVPREGTRTKEGNPLLYLPSYYIVNGFCFVPLNEMYFVSEVKKKERAERGRDREEKTFWFNLLLLDVSSSLVLLSIRMLLLSCSIPGCTLPSVTTMRKSFSCRTF